MARITFTIEDLPEGDADVIEISVSTGEYIDTDNMTYAQEMAAIVMAMIQRIREEAKNDSMSEVQDKD